MAIQAKYVLLIALAVLVLLPAKAHAFGAGNIASISAVEGKNWRHGDIEDMLATVACLKGHKWKSMMIKRVYFGNWLRDYSQAVDTATLSKVQGDTIRVLVWILAFMSFGYATGEFEVTADRLGVYRPEEHIDNPKDYADNQDARKFDPRLRGPIADIELAVDPETGMKNYIANERGNWATSAGYVKFSFSRAIHYGRMYTHGPNGESGNEANLAEALRCLGQGLHCLEDFGAHTNYTELALRELGYSNVFSHTGTQTQINLHGKHVYPLVTGTFGGVDFFHSVLGEATDHITQSEVDEMNTTLSDALTSNTKGSGGGGSCSALTDVLGKVPGTSGLIKEAHQLQAMSDAQAAANSGHGYRSGGYDDYSSSRAGGPGQHQGAAPAFDAPPGSIGGPPGPNIPGTNTDPATIIPKIYPILEFRDNVVRNISAIIEKIPGLEKLIETITERVTLFVLSLLAPFVMPIIKSASESLKQGSSTVIDSAAKHQFEVWTNPHSSDPTHSMLSKDHFSNVLNAPAGQIAVVILQFVAPRVIYAFDHPDVPVDQVLNDCMQVFHHPAIRNHNSEIHRNMFSVVEKWAQNHRGGDINQVLSSESVRAGKNHSGGNDHSQGSGHGAAGVSSFVSHGHSGGQQHQQHQQSSHASSSGGGFLGSLAGNLPGGLGSKLSPALNMFSGSREAPGDFDAAAPQAQSYDHSAASYHPSPSPGPTHDWGSFQPYQSSYAGGQGGGAPEYNAAPPGGDVGGWGAQGQYHGGQGTEPSYTVPTAYQQGYENYDAGQQGGGYGGYGQQGHSEGGGRQWGSGGGNNMY
ncbi:Het-C-domain-containing protein [Karstenula rhodostoma CBS 690.94]|uniref:Het-C-domain-containing protein n=1 Tax=Karstenula rhodostoma CBS 690.94 TaxID=1392251 RepID=A0A9P4PNW9_9PLEO|nr:Het-C-domain-containing protein [Karstenula rhodostoma CBS 690.94]